MSDPLYVYFAGPLFDHKTLAGNLQLASAIEKKSHGRYRCVLPQDLDCRPARASDVRDAALAALAESDLALFGFDGDELDAGTVVEFVFAKLLDLPSLIVRTDPRPGGDWGGGDPWNLMCQGYPRTRVLLWGAPRRYRQELARATDPQKADRCQALRTLEVLYRQLAGEIETGLDDVWSEPPLPKDGMWDSGESDDAEGRAAQALYRWAARFAGGGLERLLPRDRIAEIVTRRRERQNL